MKNQDFTLIGRGIPGLYTSQLSRIAPTPPVYFANMGIWVRTELFEKLQAFEKPVEEILLAEDKDGKAFQLARQEIKEILDSTEPFSPEASAKMKMTKIGQLIDAKMKLSGNTGTPIWKFTGIADRNPYKDGQLKQVESAAVMGTRYLVEWSFFDRNVKHYFYRAVAKALNLFTKYVEYRNWEPGQIPVPYAKKGQFPLPQRKPSQAQTELRQKVQGMLDQIENDKNSTTH